MTSLLPERLGMDTRHVEIVGSNPTCGKKKIIFARHDFTFRNITIGIYFCVPIYITLTTTLTEIKCNIQFVFSVT